ncbi:unnamed protein product [Pieris macdunnoughi]|uniref:3'-5' exonuclease domain-containing protein n=1 Tax=Pieris macdunnoughi TaxID=345717 RepID=A0A821M2P9_9NEOP|nr:unnamed protein product [Pieris macdunnoughi]
MNINNLVSSSHQSIKIVPSTEDTLKKLGLNVNLDDNVRIWWYQLQMTWQTWKISSTVDNHFVALYNFEEPYRVALVCVIKCQEFKDCKPKTLPYYIIESLQKWGEMNNQIPNDSLKLPAFHIAKMQRNQQFLNMMVQTYNIKTIKDKILPLVKDIIKNDNCKQGSQIVSALELYDDIPIEDLLFPLILQDKINIVDEYLSDSPSQVRPLLTFLDSLLDKKINIREYVQKFLEDHTVYNIKYDKLHHKPLGKFVARLCSKYNVAVATCTNLSKNRTSGGLRYLIYQKYVEHNVSDSVWDDLVKDSLSRTEGCAEEFINILCDYDHIEALKWAKFFNISETCLPSFLRNLSIQETSVDEENWDDNDDDPSDLYYKLPIDSIIMVDTAEKFHETLSSIIGCNVVSIDCEWKPSFGAVQSQVALIQIATLTNVYLFDTLIFNGKQYTSLWNIFNKSFLDNDEIIKLGFGLEQDLKEIKASVNGLNNIKIKGEGLLDLALLWKNLVDCGLCLPKSNDVEGKGLSSLVQICFGVPLKKSEQCSNWELRPLRQTQIYYAALDAYVLLEVYNYLQNLCQEQNINFEEMCNEVMLDKKPKKTKTVKLETTACSYTKPSKCLRLLIEAELSYLMGYLRYCGIDTIVINTSMAWHDAIGLALSEERNILTSKLKLSCTSKYPQSAILSLDKGTVKDQLQRILTTFHVIITPEDILTRCLYCNGVELRNVGYSELEDLNKNVQIPGNFSIHNTNMYHNDYDDQIDDFFSDSDDNETYIGPPPVPTNFSQNRKCVTNKGALIDLSHFSKILSYFQTKQNEHILLCESCGKFYWKEEETIKNIHLLITQFINSNM